ncbi:putative phosphodiesterase/alkaline phosphatase [Nocardia brasiliensis NBRC 14402]|uniref:alkaline phosphatase D family protein n=1 Tax=Nocardia brasiliensis TaxID=37326 RepID=UPI0002DA89EE|nr:alkaline phosphatase D family protein [Nocardia brasiliensis]ASF08894.1 alkaline phosphatase [Nocardia brasiliensis]GAJ81153.1 putative phosphodiesterase/alkaline phosphatase [Nocardia brasiliensis NBRC 14402]SUB40527.1 Alkaline phosphatase D precursor [Nocardia brasiliensis]
MTGSTFGFSRRTLLRTSALGLVAAPALAACASNDGPGLVRQRPVLTHGVAVGDPRTDGALIWARSDQPAKLIVETASTESFTNAKRFAGPLLTPDSDGTGRVRVNGLPAGQQVHYRVTLENESGAVSEPVTGVFRTVPTGESDIRLQWSGDVVGQGYGINPDLGGMKIFSAMAARDPHLFIHSGDSIYADNPVKESVTLPDGRIWRNTVSEAKSAPAQTLQQFRGNYAYNLTDQNYLRFNSAVAQVVQWDDHETVNNWYPGGLVPAAKNYNERSMDTLATRAWQAFHEWMPVEPKEAVDGRLYRKISYGPLLDVFVLDMRTYKDTNDANNGPEGRIFGAAQTKWLIEGLRDSTAVWKIVANDLPLGLVVKDGEQPNTTAFEGPANGDPGAPSGRETEIAQVLSAIKANKVTDVVWLTADVHYTAAHHYAPGRAAFTDFDEFWEFVSGPLNAGAFGPNPLDGTFGPEAVFVHAPPVQNSSPLDEYQHFGEVLIDGKSRELTVNLCDATGSVLFSKQLAPTAG